MAMRQDAAQQAADAVVTVAGMVAVAVAGVRASPVKASRLMVAMAVDAHQPSAQRRVAVVVPLVAVAEDSAAATKATPVAMAAVTTSSPAISATMLAAT